LAFQPFDFEPLPGESDSRNTSCALSIYIYVFILCIAFTCLIKIEGLECKKPV
jgi:hypothetical protein